MKDHRRSIKAPRRIGALSFLIVCLLLSGVLRFGDSGIALAKEVTAKATAHPPGKSDEKCSVAPDIASLLAAIKSRNEELDQKEARLENRLEALKVAELEIKQNTAAMISAEDKLAATLAIADTAAEADIKQLTTVYENMKPRNSAALFSAMDPSFAAGFLGRMRADSAARILSSLKPEKAYAISLVLAGRNANAPKKVAR